MKQLLLVFLGGGIGSALRYFIGKQFNATSYNFPWGTFYVNIIGSFLIGFIFGYMLVKDKISNTIFVFVVAGFCGGFTTFSAFGHESLLFLRAEQTSLFVCYILSSIIVGLFCVWLGYFIAEKIF